MLIKLKNKISIGPKQKTFIIAEAGINHNGKISLAYKLVDEAVKCGVDAIKFQTFKTEHAIRKDCPRPSHEIKNLKENISHFDLVKRWELSFSDFEKIKKYCEKKRIIFFSTPGDMLSAKFLVKIKCPIIKISSADMLNFPMLEIIGKSKIPLILSTGMSKWNEINQSINFFLKFSKKLVILKCTSNYPASSKSLNINGIKKIQSAFPRSIVGLSDHSSGLEATYAAVSLGAKVVERHFTLDKKMWGPDHMASLDSSELKELVRGIRKIENSLGSYSWDVQKEELSQRKVMQKGTYAARSIAKGKKIKIEDVSFLRPSNGMSPMKFYLKKMNLKSNKNYSEGDNIV